MSMNDNEEKENEKKAVTVLREKQKKEGSKNKDEVQEFVEDIIIDALTSRVNGEIKKRGGCV